MKCRAPGIGCAQTAFFAGKYRKRKKTLLFVLVVLLVAGAIFYWWRSTFRVSTDDAQIDGHINPISARVGGHVVRLNFRDYQYVEAGTLLVEIDPTDYRVAVERARAEYADALAAAKAARINVPITSVNTRSGIVSATANVANARAGVSAAEKQLEASGPGCGKMKRIMSGRRPIWPGTGHWSNGTSYPGSSMTRWLRLPRLPRRPWMRRGRW